MDVQNADPVERTAGLSGKKDDFSFEASVEIQGNPLKVYNQEEMDDGGTQGWIASKEEKAYTIHCKVQINANPVEQAICRSSYPDFEVQLLCDGVSFKKLGLKRLTPGASSKCAFKGRQISRDWAQQLVFTKPELTEHATPEKARERLGTIEVVFRRCRVYRERPYTEADSVKVFTQKLVEGPINEKDVKKKKGLLGAVTKLEDFVPSSVPVLCSTAVHPDDEEEGYFRMQLRYGPEDLLQALSHIPLKITPKLGVTEGGGRHRPIDLVGEDESDKESQGWDWEDIVVTGGGRHQPIDLLGEDESDDDCEVIETKTSDQARAQGENTANMPLVPAKTARQLEELRAELKALEEIAELEAKIKALEEGLNKKRQGEDPGPSRAARPANGAKKRKVAKDGNSSAHLEFIAVENDK